MDFGSDYVYMYEAPSFEYISDEELERGMNISDSDDSDEEINEGTDVPAPHLPHRALPLNDVLCAESPPTGALSLGSSPPAPPPPTVLHCRAAGAPKSHWRSKGASKFTADSSHGKHRRKVRQGDTNIVKVRFDKLISPSHMHAGDPEACTNCSAILSNISTLQPQEDNKVWTCEFCSTANTVDIEDEERPSEEDVTFMLEPALSTTTSGPTGMDESLVVFCVDVSGSMCVTTEVPGHFQLRGGENLTSVQSLNRERADQYLPRQRRNVTYVSRLQSVQAAIDHQLLEMTKEFPNRRVALVTFSNEVTNYGDGNGEAVNIAGDKLANKDNLRKVADEQAYPGAIKTSRQQLSKKLFDLEEGGPTALGPALLVATTMAAKVRGSKVILCTDGLANVGMGKLDNFKSTEEKDEAVQFYEDISTTAVENGVSISVITIKGTDCKLVEIGKMADQTGGQVNIVDPLKLTQEFSTILANQIIATNVEATMILHKELYFFYEETEDSKVVKYIGNVTADSEITFEYGVRTKEEEKQTEEKMEVDEDKAKAVDQPDAQPIADMTVGGTAVPEITVDPAEPSTSSGGAGAGSSAGAGPSGGAESGSSESDEKKEFPFQLQIRYTDTEGAKALRVITQTKPITRDRKKAEKLAKMDVLAAHTAMTAAKLAQDGMYTLSRERALMNQRVAWRNTRDDDGNIIQNRTKYKSAFGKIRTMENYLALRQEQERSTRGRTYSDDEAEEDEVDIAPRAMGSSASSEVPKKKTKSFFSRLRKKRSETTEDAGAALLFKGKHSKSFFDDDEEEKK